MGKLILELGFGDHGSHNVSINGVEIRWAEGTMEKTVSSISIRGGQMARSMSLTSPR